MAELAAFAEGSLLSAGTIGVRAPSQGSELLQGGPCFLFTSEELQAQLEEAMRLQTLQAQQRPASHLFLPSCTNSLAQARALGSEHGTRYHPGPALAHRNQASKMGIT